MRPWLFTAGVGIAVIGAGLMVSLFFLPAPPLDTRSSSVSITDLGATATRTWEIPEATAYSGTLLLGWNASAPVSVSLRQAVPCATLGADCPANRPLVSWTGNVSGLWSFQGAIGSNYFLSVSNFGHAGLSFSGGLTESYVVPTPSQAVPAWALILLGGLVLLSIGGLATFLGLFLEPGVYGPGRPRDPGPSEEPVDPMGDLPYGPP